MKKFIKVHFHGSVILAVDVPVHDIHNETMLTIDRAAEDVQDHLDKYLPAADCKVEYEPAEAREVERCLQGDMPYAMYR